MSDMKIEEAFSAIETETKVILKDTQKEVIKSLIKGEHVFGVLPTGYGKSYIPVYAFFGEIMDKVNNCLVSIC